MIGPEPLCMKCKHLFENKPGEWASVCCLPNGIPEEIMTGEIDHTKPYEGDNGIQFEAK